MDADSVCDELYGLTPDEFTSARAVREKEAKAEGNRELAARIHAMAKPNQVAWLANRLAREHPQELAPLVELGAELRAATSSLSGDQLRALSRQRSELVTALVQLATAGGKKISQDTVRGIQATLHAALADPGAAAQLLAGHLTVGLEYVGFGPGVGDGVGDGDKRPLKEVPASKSQLAQRELAKAREAAKAAALARDEASTAFDRAEKAATDAKAELARLRAALENAAAEESAARRLEREARTTFDDADRAARRAERHLEHLADGRPAS